MVIQKILFIIILFPTQYFSYSQSEWVKIKSNSYSEQEKLQTKVFAGEVLEKISERENKALIIHGKDTLILSKKAYHIVNRPIKTDSFLVFSVVRPNKIQVNIESTQKTIWLYSETNNLYQLNGNNYLLFSQDSIGSWFRIIIDGQASQVYYTQDIINQSKAKQHSIITEGLPEKSVEDNKYTFAHYILICFVIISLCGLVAFFVYKKLKTTPKVEIFEESEEKPIEKIESKPIEKKIEKDAIQPIAIIKDESIEMKYQKALREIAEWKGNYERLLYENKKFQDELKKINVERDMWFFRVNQLEKQIADLLNEKQ